jgi:periplasmic protein TonB
MRKYEELNHDPDLHLFLADEVSRPFWSSILENVREALFPKKLPPLKLESQPIPVKDIWGFYNYRKNGVVGSLLAHLVLIAAIVFGTLAVRGVVQEVQKQQAIEIFTPTDLVMSASAKPVGGGGGGGDHDKLQAPKGILPKLAMEQFTPPVVVVRNEHPKLEMEPTVVVPPQVKLAQANLPNLGDPSAAMPLPPSNGTGSGGGIGSGHGGGVGVGTGPGVGEGRGGGVGGGVFRVGGGVSAPRAIYAPDPEYSEEARKAKYQGTCVLWLVVGPDGRPRDIRVARSLGLGLDEKAIEAVRNWKFEPAQKDGRPVAVQINVEVDFRLY